MRTTDFFFALSWFTSGRNLEGGCHLPESHFFAAARAVTWENR